MKRVWGRVGRGRAFVAVPLAVGRGRACAVQESEGCNVRASFALLLTKSHKHARGNSLRERWAQLCPPPPLLAALTWPCSVNPPPPLRLVVRLRTSAVPPQARLAVVVPLEQSQQPPPLLWFCLPQKFGLSLAHPHSSLAAPPCIRRVQTLAWTFPTIIRLYSALARRGFSPCHPFSLVFQSGRTQRGSLHQRATGAARNYSESKNRLCGAFGEGNEPVVTTYEGISLQ